MEWLRDVYPHPVRLYQFARNEGASHGRNAGIRLASAPHLCFLDSDAVILSPDAVERSLAALKAHPEIRAVGASIWFDRERTRAFCLGGYITPEGHFHQKRTHSETQDPHFISTCFAVWEKALLEELRGFDPWYFWGIEDMDLSLRASARARRGERVAATRFLIVEDVHVLHEMASGGRHYQPNNFAAAFDAYERQRLYLVLAYGGLLEFLRVLLTSPFRLQRIQRDVWQTRLNMRQKLWSLVVYPLLRVVRLPLDLLLSARNHLAQCPKPQAVTRSTSG